MAIGPMPIGVSVSGRALFALGREGEVLAGSIGSKVRIPSFTGAKFRIPDGLTAEALSEVKNSAYVRFTGQLKDFLRFAEDRSLKFVLYVRDKSTVLSKELKELVEKGRMEVRYLRKAE